MMGRWQRLKRPLGRLLVSAVLGWLLLWSLLVIAAWWVLPRIDWQADAVGDWLSERAQMPVHVHAVDARWTRRGPVLRLHGLSLGEKGQVQIGSAQWLLAVYDGLLPGRSLSELHVAGLDLELVRSSDGRWNVHGLSAPGSDGDPLDALARLGEVQLSNSRLHIKASDLHIDRVIPRVDLRLRVDGHRLRAGLQGWAHADEAPIRASVDINRDTGTGKLWLGTDALALANWPALLRVDGAHLDGGNAAISLWVTLEHWQPQRLRLRGSTDRVDLVAADGRSLTLGGTELTGQWLRQGSGWLLQLPRLRLDGQDMDGLQVQQGKVLAIHAPRIALGPMLQVLALSERVPAGTRNWLLASTPKVVLEQVRWQGDIQGQWQGSAQLQQVSFAPVDNAPGVTGLAGRVQADQQGLLLDLDEASSTVLDWPGGFGLPHDLKLDGGIAAWADAAGWRVGLDGLHVQGTDYGARVRGSMLFQEGGSRPRLDLAAELDDAPMTAAKRFWIRSKMSPAAIDWLDAALVAGHVRDGRGLVSGDLDDWPFVDNNGRFEARARIDQGMIHFADGWKDMSEVDADVAFIGPGFELAGQGSLGGVAVKRFTAGIAQFGDPLLKVRAEGAGDSARLLQLLRESPLHAEHGSTLDALSARGPARVGFALDQKLGAKPYSKVSGRVDLDGAALGDSRWEVAFDQMHGQALYDNSGFSAPALKARLDGQPARLALRAGPAHVQRAGNAFEADLSTSQQMSALLKRAPDLAWIGNYLEGRSEWEVVVEVPADAGQPGKPMAILGLRSDLLGTVMQLPAPLDKAAGTPLATLVRAPLPMGSGMVEVGFGNRLGLLIDASREQTAVLATLGSAQAQGALPTQGLKVNGRTPRLDALPWVELASGGGEGADTGAGSAGSALSLRGIDLQADALLLGGGRFEDTHLRLTPGNGRINVAIDGPTLAGQLVVPDAAGATVVGKFRHLHWQRDRQELADAAPQAGSSDFNPASIPPLALDVERLQIGSLGLGSALLRSRPLADGLQVDVLQLRQPGQVIDVQGNWRGIGKSARTAVQVQLDSQDLGAFSRLLDQQGHLQGGQGTLSLKAGWPGGPQSFAMAQLGGNLQLTARNGQLLEVEPGAGRVLGLLSIGQLPRRMMLDFRDLFAKGLAYNQIKADIAFGNGRATSRGISIDSPAAQIQISGHADLVQQRFEQTVEVNPRSGNLLTVVGAVAGGPVGAAVGAAANAVLSKPLGEIGARTYKVSGPWKDPQVEVIDRQPVRPSSGTRTGASPAAGEDAAATTGQTQ